MNSITSKVQGQAALQNISTNQNFLFLSLHSLESNWCQSKKYGDSKADNLQRVPYSKRALLEERMINAASFFKILQSCDAGTTCRKSYVTRLFIKCNVFLSRSFRCGSHAFKATKQQVRDAQMSLHNCNTFRNITLTNSNKFIHIVTRRHNSLKIQGRLQQTVVHIESIAGIRSFRLKFVKNLCFIYYSQNLVLFNFRGDNAREFQRVSMNINMTVGQAACQLLCRYTQSTLAATCVCWIVPIVTFDSIKRTCGCSCLKCTWSVASPTGGRRANSPTPLPRQM